MVSTAKSVYFNAIRQVLYIVLMTLVVVGFWKIGDIFKNSAVMENGIFENMQVAVLGIVALLFGINAAINRTYRPILFLMCMMALAAGIREQDALFDELIPCIGWKWCWIFPILGIICCIRNRSSLPGITERFLTSSTFHMMIAAGIIMIPVAQCLGHRSFLVDLMNDPGYNATLIRRILEETVELIAYFMLMLSAIESYVEFRKPKA